MGKNKVWVARHEVEFVVIWLGNEDKGSGICGGVIHFRFGKFFVAGDFVGFVESCDEIDKEEVGIGARFEGRRPGVTDQEFVVGLECALGCFDNFGVF